MKGLVCVNSNKIKGLCFFVFVVIFAVSALSNDNGGKWFEWKRKIEIVTRFYQDILQSGPYEDQQQIDTRLKLKNKIELPAWDAAFYLNVQARYDAFIGDNTDDDVDFLLREAYIVFEREGYNFSLGRQIVTWGKLDDVVILDTMSPQNFKWFMLLDKQQRKQPVFMFKFDWYGDNVQMETVCMPLFVPSEVRFFGSDWAAFGHLREVVRKGPYTATTKDVVSRIRIEDKKYLNKHTIDNAQWGTRLVSSARDIDYSLYYMYINNRNPVLRETTSNGNALKKALYVPTQSNLNDLVALSPSDDDLTLQREHPRLHIIGSDFETVIGEYGLRGECGLFLGMPYLRDDFSYVRKDTLSLGLGIDHTTDKDWYYNVQFIENIIPDYEALFAQEEYTHQATVNVKKDFLRGDFSFELDSGYNFSLGDRMFNPELSYNLNNGVELKVGLFVFEGDAATLFGRYSAKDTVYIETTYAF